MTTPAPAATPVPRQWLRYDAAAIVGAADRSQDHRRCPELATVEEAAGLPCAAQCRAQQEWCACT